MTKDITPILDPFLSLLRSRAVLMAILVLIARVIAEYTTLSPDIQDAIVQLGFVVIGKMAIEDAAWKFGANRPPAINAGEVGTVNTTTTTETVPGQ
jgi:hypothetical protein